MNADKTMLYIKKLENATLSAKFDNGPDSCLQTNMLRIHLMQKEVENIAFGGKPSASKTLQEYVHGK